MGLSSAFDDPETFRPERWSDGLAKRIHRFAYFPFGGGPRICIGNSFAQMEAVLLLATIARQYQLRLVPAFLRWHDLKNDPGEFDNLWDNAAHAATRARMTERLLLTEIEHIDRVPLPTRRA